MGPGRLFATLIELSPLPTLVRGAEKKKEEKDVFVGNRVQDHIRREENACDVFDIVVRGSCFIGQTTSETVQMLSEDLLFLALRSTRVREK